MTASVPFSAPELVALGGDGLEIVEASPRHAGSGHRIGRIGIGGRGDKGTDRVGPRQEEARRPDLDVGITHQLLALRLIDGYGLGANSYVRKPVDFEKFLVTVEQLKRYWLGVNETPPEIVQG